MTSNTSIVSPGLAKTAKGFRIFVGLSSVAVLSLVILTTIFVTGSPNMVRELKIYESRLQYSRNYYQVIAENYLENGKVLPETLSAADLENYNRYYLGYAGGQMFENDLVYKKVSDDRFELVLPGDKWGDKQAQSLLDSGTNGSIYNPIDAGFPNPRSAVTSNTESTIIYFHYPNSPDVYSGQPLAPIDITKDNRGPVLAFSLVDHVVESDHLRLVIEISSTTTPPFGLPVTSPSVSP